MICIREEGKGIGFIQNITRSGLNQLASGRSIWYLKLSTTRMCVIDALNKRATFNHRQITNCYQSYAGLVGHHVSGKIVSSSYWTSTASAQSQDNQQVQSISTRFLSNNYTQKIELSSIFLLASTAWQNLNKICWSSFSFKVWYNLNSL